MDALNREAGERENPCANYPPDPPAHSGTYGYDTNRALCMDHLGKSNRRGRPTTRSAPTSAGSSPIASPVRRCR
jgi:hypothetical protein